MKADSLKTLEESRRKEGEITQLKQQKQIADWRIQWAAQEKEKQIRLRNSIIAVAIVVLIGAIVTSYFYLSKRKEHKKLTIAYRDLDSAKTKLEAAEKRIVNLLSQQVSHQWQKK